MRTRLAGDRDAAGLGLTQQSNAPGRTHVLAVDVCPGFLSEQNVTRNNHFLPRTGPARQAKRAIPVALMHYARAHQRIVLAMIHHRQVKHRRVFQRATHQVIVLHTMAVVGNRHHPGAVQRADRRQFLPGNPLRDRAGRQHVDPGRALGAVLNQCHRARVVDRRTGVGHANHRGEPAPRRRSRAGLDVLLGRLARFAKMHVNIDQPRANHPTAGINLLNPLRRLAKRVGSDRRHPAIDQQHVGRLVPAVCGVDHPASLEQQ